MKQRIARSCGHSTEEQLYGSSNDRSRKLAWLKSQPCPTCKRNAETTQAEDTATIQSLPALQGSEKQIEWAVRIRKETLDQIDRLVAGFLAQGASEDRIEAEMGSAIRTIRNETRAAWWIDHRQNSAHTLLTEFVS